jgi:hypothetical protein
MNSSEHFDERSRSENNKPEQQTITLSLLSERLAPPVDDMGPRMGLSCSGHGNLYSERRK